MALSSTCHSTELTLGSRLRRLTADSNATSLRPSHWKFGFYSDSVEIAREVLAAHGSQHESVSVDGLDENRSNVRFIGCATHGTELIRRLDLSLLTYGESVHFPSNRAQTRVRDQHQNGADDPFNDVPGAGEHAHGGPNTRRLRRC